MNKTIGISQSKPYGSIRGSSGGVDSGWVSAAACPAATSTTEAGQAGETDEAGGGGGRGARGGGGRGVTETD